MKYNHWVFRLKRNYKLLFVEKIEELIREETDTLTNLKIH